MIEVKLTFGTFAEAAAFFSRDAMIVAAGDAARELLAGAAALNDIPAEVQEAAAPVRKPRAKKNAEAPAEAVADAAPAAVAPEQEATAEPKEEVIQLHTLETVDAAVSDKSYTVDDVRKALQAYSGREGFPAATELVKSFGATRITELKPEDYAAFIAKTEEKVTA
jgi:hypothetical protein